MFSPIARCSYCCDEYDPVEYATVPQDPDEPRFCSDDCETGYWDCEEFTEIYRSAGTGAPVFP